MVTTIPGVAPYKIPDRVKRGWDQGRPDRVRMSDNTYLRTGEGWLYLAAVTDAHSRRILGWSMDSHMVTFPGRQSPGNGSNTAWGGS
ncbi:hypothetical protein Csp1_03490 [Corynebacterium provencense]|uniref:Integrase catalytic domain-containing protein n=1 Tax=Corynebacterium provencense TaxID=1737425 RepID=A0A2Z3YLP8_9CORY|nr:hypothetical protein Csp1_03490 [Corynebacterium provencense]